MALGDPRPLDGRVAVVTGVGRRAGIGYAIARPKRSMPQGRWGEPDDAARPIRRLCRDDAQWITG